MSNTTFNWTNQQGLPIFGQVWTPAGEVKAVIALVHGQGEHSSRYHHVADFFNKNGIALVGIDHQGHGKSGGKRGHTASYSSYLDDVDRLITEAKTRFPNAPLIMYGHSMGGNFVLGHLINRKTDAAAVIATGPWIGLVKEPSAALVAIGKFLAKIAPSVSKSNELDVNHISRDKNEVKKYQEDPLVHDKISFGAGMELLNGAAAIANFKGEITVPLLIMHGTGDQITSHKASEAFANQVSGDVTLKLWDGLYHEIHNEAERQEVLDYAMAWINQKI